MARASPSATGSVDTEPVEARWTDPVLPMVAVDLHDGSTIKATGDHPFYVDASAVRAHAGWVHSGSRRVTREQRHEYTGATAGAGRRSGA